VVICKHVVIVCAVVLSTEAGVSRRPIQRKKYPFNINVVLTFKLRACSELTN
jgi:hypothetical protein